MAPVISVTASANGNEADGSPAVFSFSRTGNTARALSVSYQLFGTAQAGSDYTGNTTGTVSFAAGSSTATLSLPALADGALIDPGETIIARIDPAGSYSITPGKQFATATITAEGMVVNADEQIKAGWSNGGHVKILGIDGSVKDAISGKVFLPGHSDYKSAALSNKVTNLKDLSIGNLQNKPPEEIKINETGMIAPYAIVNGMDTYFAFAAANADLISHFKILGTNVFSLEDIHGGGDKDFDDVVIGIKF